MNKVLFFSSVYNTGISSLLTDQIIALKEAKVNIIAIADEKEQERGLLKKIIEKKVDIKIFKGLDVHSNFFSLSNKIKNIIKDYNIDIVHVQSNWQLAIVAFIKYVLLCPNIKIVYTIHAFRNNTKIKSMIAQIFIGLALLLFADKVICMCNYLKRKFSFLSYKIFLLPLGVSDEYFIPYFVEPPLDKGLQMVFPAQFRKGKNQNIIIKAFARFVKETKDTKSCLVLPGSGELLGDMKNLTKELGIENRISFPGQCTKSEIKKYYLESNIGIVSSNSETFGQSIVEPFVLGRCVISRPVGIAQDIIKNENGFIFNDEEDLYNILIEINNDFNRLKSCGQLNYNSREIFMWSNISNKYKDFFSL